MVDAGPEQFWMDRIGDLFTPDNWTYILPNDNMTADQRLNAILRLSMYASLVLVVLRQNVTYLVIPAVVAAATLVIHKAGAAKKELLKAMATETEVFDAQTGESCTRPMPANPFMNIMVNEYADNPERGRACDVEDRNVKNKMHQYFQNGLFRNVDDIYDTQSGYRQFYTMPVTTIPNDVNTFAQWLYSDTGKIRDSYGGSIVA
jgi:hypothetical protein